MPIIASEPESNITPAPEGLHPAVCCDVVDLGMVEDQWGTKHAVQIRWELEEKNEETGKPFMATKRYRLSLHEKAQLCKDLQTWRGRKFTAEELKGFDIEALIGVCCQVQIVHNLAPNGKTYGNVQAIVPFPKSATKLRVSDGYVRKKDRDVTSKMIAEAAAEDEAGGIGDGSVPF